MCVSVATSQKGVTAAKGRGGGGALGWKVEREESGEAGGGGLIIVWQIVLPCLLGGALWLCSQTG